MNRRSASYITIDDTATPTKTIPPHLLRATAPQLPALSELQVVRHYTQLSEKNYSIDTQFYPLGSCTMKYNPKVAHVLASLPGFLAHHPHTPTEHSQTILAALYELQTTLCQLTGMHEVALSPMAGAQGEWAGVAMIRAYHAARGDTQRTEMLIPTAAHGTNPASAQAAGCVVREIPLNANGDLDINVLRQHLGPRTAGIMLTNPSTVGLFEQNIVAIAAAIHEAGGLLYYDGANLNAILGKYRPGDMGFDVMHLNLHKTFATPHGGGGPGAGPVAANARLAPFLPIPRVQYDQQQYRWLTEPDCPQTVGRLSAFYGNVGVLLRAWIYCQQLGSPGLQRVSDYAVLNANYLMHQLQKIGYTLAFPQRRASHEFVITLKPLTQQYGVSALDLAKRLLDYNCYAPTIYFPALVPECLLIEPTETESKETLDQFIEAMRAIYQEILTQPTLVKTAPHTCSVGRLDEVLAARQCNVRAS